MVAEEIKALAFDVFGTVVDWRATIIEEGARFSAGTGVSVDWGQFADAWRGRYRPSMDRVMRGELPWMTIDELHRLALDEVLREFDLESLTEGQRAGLNRIWHRLRPWPDAVPGLTRLRARYVLATLSNGNVALLVDLAKYARLPWDCVLSAELARAYKPDPAVYRMACALLDLRPAQVMMVAARQDDLRAARAEGLRTAFIPRPLEHGPDAASDPTPDAACDVVAADLVDLARRLGA
jgi:2-haloacid dehalogenase